MSGRHFRSTFKPYDERYRGADSSSSTRSSSSTSTTLASSISNRKPEDPSEKRALGPRSSEGLRITVSNDTVTEPETRHSDRRRSRSPKRDSSRHSSSSRSHRNRSDSRSPTRHRSYSRSPRRSSRSPRRRSRSRSRSRDHDHDRFGYKV